MFMEPRPTRSGRRCPSPGAAALEGLGYGYESSFFEHLEVAAQVAVCEVEALFQECEIGPVGLDQYRQDAKADPLVDHVIQSSGRVLL